jgi:hypothetical protein
MSQRRTLWGATTVMFGLSMLALPSVAFAANGDVAPPSGDFAGMAATAARDGAVRVIVELKAPDANPTSATEVAKVRDAQQQVE